MDPLAEHCDKIIEKVRELAPKALVAGDADAIHDARVATRRMRAALRLVGPLISDEHRKPLARALRRLRRRLGAARDLDVMIDHLKSMKRARSHAAPIEWLTDRLDRSREEERKDNADDSASNTLAKLGTWWGVREQMNEHRDQIDALLANSLHQQLDAFADRSNELVLAQNTVDAHQLRIAGKSLRYTLEMAQACGHPIENRILKLFKKMQEALGMWHDYVVLAERAMCECSEAMLAHHDAPLQKQMLALTNLSLRRADRQLKKFAELWQANGAAVSGAIYAAFPKAAANESQTDHGPSGSDGSPAPAELVKDDPAAV